MCDYDDLQMTFVTAAARDLPQLVTELADLCSCTGEADLRSVREILARAWLAGAHAGQIETIAQAVKQGAHIDHQILGGPNAAEH